MTEFFVADVFTDKPFGGNQLAVMPDATRLPEEMLQKIAREFNFSEVAFVYPPRNPANTARVRIFTPKSEIPFAGHPTIGTVKVLSDLGYGPDMVLELDVGELKCRNNGSSAQFTIHRPFEILARPETGLIARSLGLPLGAIKSNSHAPTLCSLGLNLTLTEVHDRQALSSIMLDIATVRAARSAYPQGLGFAQYVYTIVDDVVHARMFAPLDDIPEDPATGAAAATLAAFRGLLQGQQVNLDIRQGEDMGRPSRIRARTGADGVTVEGDVFVVMRGKLML